MTAHRIHSPKSGQKPTLSGLKQSEIKEFQKTVLSFFKKHGRELPWRKTTDPYRILVSEIMLQQTQADRVVPKYKSFLKKFPTVKVLAGASLGSVIKEWQGLGYNRRAKMLHALSKAIVSSYKSKFPQHHEELVALPGVGKYTASAVRVFAFNKPEVLIETNVRTVFLHHFFTNKNKVTDLELVPYIGQSLYVKNPRLWYSALMDYGSHLKKTLPNPSRKSAHHKTQPAFKGSNREVRGALLRTISRGHIKKRALVLPFPKEKILQQVDALKKEGLLIEKRGSLFLP